MTSDTAPPADAAVRALVRSAPAALTGVVTGAPGSGKTTLLVERAAALVAAGSDPDAVLALTPTRQTATALRDRLSLALGRATSGPPARSLTSFAFQLVRAHAVHTGDEPPLLLTASDDDQILADLLAGDAEDEASGRSRWPDALGAATRATRGFRGELRAFIADARTLALNPARIAALADAEAEIVWTALASFLAEYEGVLGDMRASTRDAAGLTLEAVELVRALPVDHPVFAAVRRLDAVIVDDAQELTSGGVDLLAALRDRGVGVVAFGDPDLASGAYRGARPENLAALGARLGSLGALTEPHRAQGDLIEAQRRVTVRIGAAGGVAHRTAPAREWVGDGGLRAVVAASVDDELDEIARTLRERRLRDGVPWGELAVIAHDTRQVQALEAGLAAREVPTRGQGQGVPLGQVPAVRDLLTVVLAAGDAVVAPAAAADVLVAAGLDPLDVRRVRTALRHAHLGDGGGRTGAELLAAALDDPMHAAAIDSREGRAVVRTAEALSRMRAQLADGATAHDLLWTAWEASGRQAVWLAATSGHGPVADQAHRDLDAVVALFQAAKRDAERDEDAASHPLRFVHAVLATDVAPDLLGRDPDADVVAVLSPAAALGREFDTVVIAGVQEGVWPNTRLRGTLLGTWRLHDAAAGVTAAAGVLDRRRAVLHDELRLFVRALSRARTRVVVTATSDDDHRPSGLFSLLPDAEAARALPALTLRGVVAQLRRAVTADVPDRSAAAQLAALASAGVAGARPDDWYGVGAATSDAPLHSLAHGDIRVSPSRLAALEQCELDWVVRELGADAGSTVAGLGTLIHAALEGAPDADAVALWEVVDARWNELGFESEWLERAGRERARDLVDRLAQYLRDFAAGGGELLASETPFEVEIPLPPHDGEGRALLRGVVDRVERRVDGTVVIVDLKTGRAEPRTDKAVVENPQLLAYQLAHDAGAIAPSAGLPAGGAELLVLHTGTAKPYLEPRQAPLDDEARERFIARLQHAIAVMAGTRFAAPYEQHCRDEHAHGACRIHVVGAVSAP